jgi:hypothetical protein
VGGEFSDVSSNACVYSVALSVVCNHLQCHTNANPDSVMVHSLLWSAPAPAEAPAATASERVLNSSLPLISFAISSAVRPSKSQPPSCSSESSISATRCGCVSAVIPKPRNLSHLLEFVLSVSWQIQRFASCQTTRGMFLFRAARTDPIPCCGRLDNQQRGCPAAALQI